MPGETRFPVTKASKLRAQVLQSAKPIAPVGTTVVAQFRRPRERPDGSIDDSPDAMEAVGPCLNLPADVTPEHLQLLLNNLLANDVSLPYAFFVDDTEITGSVYSDVIQGLGKTTEETLTITYQPQAVFRVRQITRCSSSLPGHTEAVLSVCFSPDGRFLATGSGDTTVRLWDLNSETPKSTLKGHKNWVQYLAWSPDCRILASGSMDNTVILWDFKKGVMIGAPLRGHTGCITCLSWEPFHLNPKCVRLASSSRDGTIKVWNTGNRQCEFTYSQHTGPVTCIAWGGEGLLYSGSRDKTIKVWSTSSGILVRSLEGHGHWINHLALSTDWVMRTGPFGHEGKGLDRFATIDEARSWAQEQYDGVKKVGGGERLVSASDDFTLFLWLPNGSKKPLARMTGHQQLVNHVSFSPDGRLIASASFDKSVKIWDGLAGKFLSSLRGHVGAVYQVCWSSDSRLLVSSSKDSTLKLWDMKTKKLKLDLPGHLDEVFAVDWSPDGGKVASGGRDRVVKLWKN